MPSAWHSRLASGSQTLPSASTELWNNLLRVDRAKKDELHNIRSYANIAYLHLSWTLPYSPRDRAFGGII